jgi:hypothetical protein|uniref:C2H2-type domain-containing protein n=1 Tax=viral metagenome TaxID=1070528 RepID=A0A6C0IRF6_9ZZZZ
MKKSPKISYKFICEICDYKCSKNSEYKKHLSTAKHKNLTNPNKKSPIIYHCSCGKIYKHRSTLSAHKRVCNESPVMDEPSELHHQNEPISTKHEIVELIIQNQEFKELMVEQSKHIQDIQQQNQDLQQQLLEAVKEGKTIHNTINNNQKFNLHFFLNEQCKDAINMSEFIDNIELDMEDLTETGRLGYVGGISRILVNKLQELDIYKRPLHCTDMKRETLYIRENDEWSKENNSKEKINDLVNKVAHKNCKNIRQWTDEHPEYNIFDSPENMEFIRLTQAVLGGLGDQECKQYRDKIIRGVIKEVMVNKL